MNFGEQTAKFYSFVFSISYPQPLEHCALLLFAWSKKEKNYVPNKH